MSPEFVYETMPATGTLREITDRAKAFRLKFYGTPKVKRYVPPAPVETEPEPVAAPVIEEVAPVQVVIRKPPGFNNFSTIQQYVARHYGMTRDALLVKDRSDKFVRPRQVAMFLTKEITKKSFAEIGRSFGGYDHSTLIAAVRSVEARCASDHIFGAELEQMRAELAVVLA